MQPVTASIVAARYDLGTPLREPAYADRGELGRIWRLDTDRGSWAVKELLISVDEADADADVRFQLVAAAGGVPLPSPRRTTDGRVVIRGSEAESAALTLRVYAWAELAPGPITHAELGALTATLHGLDHPSTDPIPDWYANPLPPGRWHQVRARFGNTPWADAFAKLDDDLAALDSWIAPADPAEIRTCHRDINTENLRRGADGGVIVLDWENSGPAIPARELAMILADSPDNAALEIYDAYRTTGGPATIRRPEDFSAAIAVQAHLLDFYSARAADPSVDPETRDRAARQLHGMLALPLTPERIHRLLQLLR